MGVAVRVACVVAASYAKSGAIGKSKFKFWSNISAQSDFALSIAHWIPKTYAHGVTLDILLVNDYNSVSDYR